MNQASKIKPPPINLFGDVVLLQLIQEETSAIVLPSGTTATSPRRTMFVAAKGDGPRCEKLNIGDELEIVRPPTELLISGRTYNGVDYLLMGLDNILGVRTD